MLPSACAHAASRAAESPGCRREFLLIKARLPSGFGKGTLCRSLLPSAGREQCSFLGMGEPCLLKPSCVLRAITQLGAAPVLLPVCVTQPCHTPQCPLGAVGAIPIPVPVVSGTAGTLHCPPSLGHSGGLPVLPACSELWFLCDLSPLSKPIEVFQLRSYRGGRADDRGAENAPWVYLS